MKMYAAARKYRVRGSSNKKALIKDAYKKNKFIRYKRKRGWFRRFSVLECFSVSVAVLATGYITYDHVNTKYPEILIEVIKYIHYYGFF